MTADAFTAAPARDRSVPVLRDAAWPAAVFLLAVLLCLPFTRTVQWLADEGIWLSGAVRLLHGQILYADIFAVHPPGGFLITAGWLYLFGTSLVAGRLLVAATVAGTACFTFLACRHAGATRLLSALLPVAWVVMSQGLGTQVNHHYFTTFLSMLAAWRVLGASGGNDKAAYLAAGLATMVTPSRGILLGTALVAAWPKWPPGSRALAMRAIAFAAAPLALLGYIAGHHALAAAYADLVVFPATRYADVQWVSFGASANAQNLPLLYVFPITAIAAALAVACRGRGLCAAPKFRFCLALAVAGTFGAWPRPDIFHLAFTSPMVLPLLAMSHAELTGGWKARSRVLLTTVMVVLCVPAGAAFTQTLLATRTWVKAPSARGKILVPGNGQARARLIARLQETPPGETIFVYPYLMLLPYLTGHDQPGRYDIFVPGYTTSAQYREGCLAALRDATWVVVDKAWMSSAFITSIFPALRDANPPEKRMMDAALEKAFDQASDDGEFILRRRRGAADLALCSQAVAAP